MSHQNPRTPSRTRLDALTAELIDEILALLDYESLKRLRSCCKWLARDSARHLFRTIRVDLSVQSMERIIGIAEIDAISNCVRNLVLLNWEGWREYEYDEFCNKLVLEGEPPT